MRPEYHKLMDELKSYEQLIQDDKGNYSCFLKNHPQAADCFYDQAFGNLTLGLRQPYSKEPTNLYYVFLCINSIDDGSVVLIGSSEPKDKALTRLERVKTHIEDWGGWIPTIDQVRTCCTDCGLFWNR